MLRTKLCTGLRKPWVMDATRHYLIPRAQVLFNYVRQADHEYVQTHDRQPCSKATVVSQPQVSNPQDDISKNLT